MNTAAIKNILLTFLLGCSSMVQAHTGSPVGVSHQMEHVLIAAGALVVATWMLRLVVRNRKQSD